MENSSSSDEEIDPNLKDCIDPVFSSNLLFGGTASELPTPKPSVRQKRNLEQSSDVYDEHQLPPLAQEYISKALYAICEKELVIKKPKINSLDKPMVKNDGTGTDEEEDGGILLLSNSKVMLKDNETSERSAEGRKSSVKIYDPQKRLEKLEAKLGGYRKENLEDNIKSSVVTYDWVVEKKGVYGNGRERQGEVIPGEWVKDKTKDVEHRSEEKTVKEQDTEDEVKKKNKRNREGKKRRRK